MITFDSRERLLVVEFCCSVEQLRRYLPDQRLDRRYDGGEVIISDSRLTLSEAFAVDGLGRTLIGGNVQGSDLRVGRRLVDGKPDLGFGRRGVASAGIQGAYVAPTAIVVDHRGRILVAGSVRPRAAPNRVEFVVARFLGGNDRG